MMPDSLPAASPQAGGSEQARFLLLDSRIVADTSNAVLRLGSVAKHTANPLFVEDRAWEKRFDNLYGNVTFDAAARQYTCWYSPFSVDISSKGMSLQEREQAPEYAKAIPKGREMSICYATSQDGINWEKPALGLVEYDGSKHNNIIWRGPHGASVFRDAREADPALVYKMFMRGIKVSFSADGLTWSGPTKLEGVKSVGDTHNNAIWAPTLGKYVAMTRTWTDADEPQEGEAPRQNLFPTRVREVARTESADFVNWSPAQVVISDPATWNLQPYAMPIFYHGGVYLGLLAVHEQSSDRVWTELAWSPDTAQWHRIEQGTPFIACSQTELDYDYGCVYACVTPIFLEHEIRVYYGGSDWLHTGYRNGCLALATLRPDGFAGWEQDRADEPAVVQTTPLTYSGQAVGVSADVAPGGSVECRLLDMSGGVLARGELRETSTDAAVLPRGTSGAGGQVRLEFALSSAKLFSFVLL